ncbi:MAG: hypothetical protein HY370_00295 [Proteobacteria bacterium]|nr:hypothetical protein [Pseudomonadota bacterium]
MPMQSTNHILLIEPVDFYANPETMETNVYQVDEKEPHEETLKKAREEFEGYKSALEKGGVRVTAMRGIKGCPDMLFPNWISTHEGGGMILYPMLSPNRRRERVPEIIDAMKKKYKILHDLRDWENKGLVVEATGSLCLDRVDKVVYAALSKRTEREAVLKWADLMGYEPVLFETRSHTGKPVYHTDLAMFIGTEMAAVCAECIVEQDRARVLGKLRETHDVLELTMDQEKSFCGNSLEVVLPDGKKALAMSSRAYGALTDENKKFIAKYFDRIIHAPIPTIETYGGGSGRCLMMEMF